jgi:hypothetical protein
MALGGQGVGAISAAGYETFDQKAAGRVGSEKIRVMSLFGSETRHEKGGCRKFFSTKTPTRRSSPTYWRSSIGRQAVRPSRLGCRVHAHDFINCSLTQ